MSQLIPLKILVISHEYPPVGGGGGKVVKSLCDSMASDQYSFHILTAFWNGLPEKESTDNLLIERLPSHRTEAHRANFLTMACFVWKSFWRALKIIKNWQPSLIHAHFAVPGGAAAALAGILTHTPYMFTAHGGDVPGGTPEKTEKWFRFIRPFTHFIWKRAQKVIAVSNQTRKLAQIHYPVDIKVIPNGLDTARYQPGEIRINDPPCIMFVGRFSPEKNAVMVPKILSHIKDFNWTCQMIGDGLQMETVRSLINEYNLGDRVELTGWISPDEVDQRLLSCDILLMPSFREGMPMAGLQALASGSALVLSDIGACGDMVDIDKNGFLISVGDENAFVDALRTLLSSHKRLLGFRKHSLKKAKDFDIDKTLEHYEKAYQSIAKVPE